MSESLLTKIEIDILGYMDLISLAKEHLDIDMEWNEDNGSEDGIYFCYDTSKDYQPNGDGSTNGAHIVRQLALLGVLPLGKKIFVWLPL